MELAIVKVPCARLLPRLRVEQAHLIGLGNRNRCGTRADNPVDCLRALRLGIAALIRLVDGDAAVHARGRRGQDRHLVDHLHAGFDLAALEVGHVELLGDLRARGKHRGNRAGKNHNKRNCNVKQKLQKLQKKKN